MLTSAVLLLTASLAAEPAEVTMPEQVRAAMQFLVGEWEAEGKMNDDSLAATQTVRWAAGKHCLVMTYKSNLFVGAGIGGWDPTTNAYVETWYRSDGLRIEQRFSHITDKVWEGTAIVQEPSGATNHNTIRLEKTADSFTFNAKSEKGAVVSHAKRVKKQKP